MRGNAGFKRTLPQPFPFQNRIRPGGYEPGLPDGGNHPSLKGENDKKEEGKKEYIKWVDFGVTSEAMNQAFRFDVETCREPIHLNWVDLLAYLGTKYGGDFGKYKAEHMNALAQQLKDGATIEELTKDMKYYSYYRNAYGAVLDGMVGEFQAEIPASEAPAAYLPQA